MLTRAQEQPKEYSHKLSLKRQTSQYAAIWNWENLTETTEALGILRKYDTVGDLGSDKAS